MTGQPNAELVPLPAQPDGVPWPTDAWPAGDVPDGVDLEGFLDELFDDEARCTPPSPRLSSIAARLIAERYAKPSTL